MAVVKKSALVQYSTEQMFRLVKDVEAYPDFLPWCRSTRLLKSTEQEICAEIVVSRLGIRQAFSTCNRFEVNKWMGLELQKGPFKRLRGDWKFLPLGEDACKIELDLDFEFSGVFIDKAFGSVFQHAANTLVDSFCKRADEVYGG